MWVMAEVVEEGERRVRGDREDRELTLGCSSRGGTMAETELGGGSRRSGECRGTHAFVTLSLLFLSCWKPRRQGGAKRDEMR